MSNNNRHKEDNNIKRYEKEINIIVSEIMEEEFNENTNHFKEKNDKIDNLYEYTLGEIIEDYKLIEKNLKFNDNKKIKN